jgi:hypothetical protein
MKNHVKNKMQNRRKNLVKNKMKNKVQNQMKIRKKNNTESNQRNIHMLAQIETTLGFSRYFECLIPIYYIEDFINSGKLSCEREQKYKTQAYEDLIQLASKFGQPSGDELINATLKYLCCLDQLSSIIEENYGDLIRLSANIRVNDESLTTVDYLDPIAFIFQKDLNDKARIKA